MARHLASLVLPLVALSTISAAQTAAPPEWFTDAATGCKVWNETPGPGDSISWSGGCVNGLAQGQGTLQWFESGKPTSHYEGSYHAGKMDGHGVFTMANGDRYEGAFKDDEFNGYGIYTWASGERYDGMWADNKPNGQGIKTESNGEVFNGTWINGCFKHGDRRAVAYTTAKACQFE
jgi:hypothetical protein